MLIIWPSALLTQYYRKSWWKLCSPALSHYLRLWTLIGCAKKLSESFYCRILLVFVKCVLILLITSYLCSNMISKIIRLSNHMIKIWLCFEQQTWKYFTFSHDAQTSQPSVCKSWPYAKYLFVWSSHSVNSHISSFRWNPKPFAKILWSLTQPLVLKFPFFFHHS